MNKPGNLADTLTQDGRPSAPSSDQIPESVGKYRLRGEIGRGACGVVHKGYDPFVQRDVAVKIALSVDGEASGPSSHQDFFTEARAAGMLQHPHIVGLYDAGMEGDLSYIVMEYIDGETLSSLCRRDGKRAPVDQVVDIGFKCARALDYSHSRGVLHRDIKPGNIMLTRDGVPKIMDFSIAEINAAPGEGSGKVGSPLYMPPEQVRGDPLGPSSDLYALGAVLFQLLTGRPPFESKELVRLFRAIRERPAPRPSEYRPDIPQELDDMIARLLEKDQEDRPESGREVSTTLSRLFDRMRMAEYQLSRRENRDSLRGLRFFDSFDDAEIDEIVSASTMMTYQAGDTIVSEGEIDHAFFLLAVGAADVRKGGITLQTLARGDCFGEIGFLTAARRTASVIATDRVLALKVNGALMDQVSQSCQLRFYKVFTETLIYRLSVTSAKLSAQRGG